MTPEKFVLGPIFKGLTNNVTPFNIDNDAFPTLVNAYQWRGRVKRKRGTKFLGRLTRYFNSNISSYGSITSFNLAAGSGNLLTGFSLEETGNIVPGSINILVGGPNYTDPAKDGTLTGGSGGQINYATGDITITGGGAGAVSGSFLYYPGLPVLGLEDQKKLNNAFPGTIGFDTTYSYIISNTDPVKIYDVSFYKNLPTAEYPGYIQKTNWTPTSWNGEDYQQFWSTNYQGAFWVTNGIDVPFTGTNIGMQFKPIVTVTITSAGPPAIATLEITGHKLVKGDFVFINEVLTTKGINFQTGYVIAEIDANNVSVEFPNATLLNNGTGGIAQYLTNRADPTLDCIRWFDGDPTNTSATSPSFVTGLGWVNFMPPLSFLNYSIANTPAAQYYLVGARMIVPFKDRLLFIGPVIQTSAVDSQIYLQDTVIYSENGTTYYTASFASTSDNDVNLSTTIFNPILVPLNQSAIPAAYFEDITGFGGFISAGVDQPAITVSTNEDVLMIGFDPNLQTKLIYSGNDITPFNFYLINSEYGASSTFSSINLDKGVFTTGTRGIVISSQDQVSRIDLDIPDQIFQFNLLNNGNERVTAQRDFINEWIYFTYLSNELAVDNESEVIFPNQTLFYNYRDGSWGIFNESYTHYGQYVLQTGLTWATVGEIYPRWKDWSDPWDSGETTACQPDIIAGNQQGFVLIRDEGTGEGQSLSIKSFTASEVTSLDHGLNQGDYILITGALGPIGPQVNDLIFSVDFEITKDTFTLNPTIDGDTYLGGAVIKRFYVPFIQTKQFPMSWSMGRKTRLGVQRYLFTKTSDSEVTLNIYLSQDSNNPYNFGPVVPSLAPDNSSLTFSSTIFTCPESTNLGLTPANINLQTPTADNQAQLWHRVNTSLIGDTIQLGITMSDKQMREVDDDGSPVNATAEIEFHGCVIDVTASQMLV